MIAYTRIVLEREGVLSDKYTCNFSSMNLPSVVVGLEEYDDLFHTSRCVAHHGFTVCCR
jgi:hypothetical protein